LIPLVVKVVVSLARAWPRMKNGFDTAESARNDTGSCESLRPSASRKPREFFVHFSWN
jgi:hypothetical protein